MPCHPYACRARVGEKHRIVGSKIAQRRRQELRTYGLDLGPLFDIVLQKTVERLRVRELFVEKAVVGLVTDALQQCRDGRLDVSDKPEVHGCPAADVFGIFVDLDFLYATVGQEFFEGKVSAEQQ